MRQSQRNSRQCFCSALEAQGDRKLLPNILELFGRVDCRWPFWGNYFEPSRVELPTGGIFSGRVGFRSSISAGINFELSRMSSL